MKKPKLEFKRVWIVSGWATKIKIGWGVFFPELKESICTYSDYWLVFIDGETMPTKIYKNEVFEDENKAYLAFNSEKSKYKKYLQEQIEKNTEQLKQL